LLLMPFVTGHKQRLSEEAAFLFFDDSSESGSFFLLPQPPPAAFQVDTENFVRIFPNFRDKSG